MKRIARVHVITAGLLVFGLKCLSANPTGGQVTSGSAAINTVPGTVTVNQQSNIAIINWQTFSIGSGELTKFVQPTSTSAALNRVLGGQVSNINGTLSANGQIYLINGNGIVVGPGGVVTANSFTASTRDIADADFLSGNFHFTGSDASGVQNLGTINALGGDVYLIGKTVDNQGKINATSGTVGLAAADDVVLNFSGEEHVFVNPSPTATAASSLTAVHNSGTISAASAELKAANGNLYALAINNEGTIRATAVAQSGGRIFLTTDTGSIQNNGTMTAVSGKNGGHVSIIGGSVWNSKTINASGAVGGSVSINSENVQNDGSILAYGTQGAGGSVGITYSNNALGDINGVINASGYTQGGSIDFTGTGANSEAYLSLALKVNSTHGTGGSIDIATPTLYLTGASLNADGATQGGRVFLGEGDPLSSPTLALAQTTYISEGTSIIANATSSGNGGAIGIAATGTTDFYGTANAAGANHGKKGTVSIFSNATLASQNSAGANQFVFSADSVNLNSQNSDSVVSSSGTPMPAFEFVDPDPGPNNAFGQPFTGLFNLSTNNTLITSPGDSFGGAGAGATYLFSDTNGALLSTIRGSHPGDNVGAYGSVDLLSHGNFLLKTPGWNSNTGAVTFGNGTTGFIGGGGDISATNSLVGSTSGDQVGSGGVTFLNDGNFLVNSPNWSGGTGAVTWESATTGLAGVVSSSNSLVGASAGDKVGSGGIFFLNNGDFLVRSPLWGSSAGALTWENEATGLVGVVGSGNSLVGSSPGDGIGSGGIQELYNDTNYLVLSPGWSGGMGAITNFSDATGVTGAVSASNSLVGASTTDAVGSFGSVQDTGSGSAYYLVTTSNWGGSIGAAGAGAVTWNSETSGTVGVVSATNSLVGSSASDHIGSGGVTVLFENGNYVVDSPDWNGTMGAVTWGSLTTGVSGVVSASNSLVGSTSGDLVGGAGIFELFTGATGTSYVVASPNWNGNTGAVTWASDSTGISGVVSSSNSLVGAASGDRVGSGGIFELDDGNFLVRSPSWGGGAGAVTWESASAGLTGVLGSSNSLVGATSTDSVGSGGVEQLSNGANYLVLSPDWGGGQGAVTNGSDSTGVSGLVSASNSLVGISTTDHVGTAGTITDSFNGYYLVTTSNWAGGLGAVTWNSDSAGTVGVISTSNSLVGSTSGDRVGSGGITILFSDGNYLVDSPNWNTQAGAVTWGDGSVGVSGTVSASNSLVGATRGDQIGSGGITLLFSNASYIVNSPNWNSQMGAVTLASDSTGVSGVVGASNSLVGSTSGDLVGSGGITQLDDGNFLVLSPNWGGGAGAVTWEGASTGIVGAVGPANSLVGSSSSDAIGSGGIQQLSNGANYLVLSPSWGGGMGAITNGSDASGAVGAVSAANSLVGASTTDGVGSFDSVYDPFTGYYLVTTLGFDGGAGAVTWSRDNAGTVGVISASNSLVGATSSDAVGNYGITILDDDNFLVNSPNWNSQTGAVTWGSATSGVSGLVSASNSLVGAASGDQIGSDGIEQLSNGANYLVLSPLWGGGMGAVTNGSDATGISGVVSASNSLVGATTSDAVGSAGSITDTFNSFYLVTTSNWSGGAGAVTWSSDSAGTVGVVSAANSLVGSAGGDQVGSGGITYLYLDGTYLVNSPNWNAGAGAVTLGNDTTGVKGVVSASNSLTGASSGDHIGSGGIDPLYDGNYLVLSHGFAGGAGAVTWGNGLTGITGQVSAANSLIGASSGDNIGSGGVTYLYDGNYLVRSPGFAGGAGAVTWGSDASGVVGVVGATNSLVGASSSDHIGSGGIIFLPNGNYLVQSPLFASSAGAVTWGSETGGVVGTVSSANSITGGGPNSGEEFAGYSANESVYLIAFTTDTSAGGDGRVWVGSVNGPSSTPAPTNLFTTQAVLSFSVSGLNIPTVSTESFVLDTETLALEPVGVDSSTDSALNTGSGENIASGSSMSRAPGPRRLVTPGNGIWNIFGGIVHSGPPPAFVVQQLKLNLSPAVYARLNQFLFSNP